MIDQIRGLHHVTSMASGARENNRFFTQLLGLRRVKKTVNFDQPHVYHLYYGDAAGTAGTVMTYFPFPQMARGENGNGEVAITGFSIPDGTVVHWRDRLSQGGAKNLSQDMIFGAPRLLFDGPDGERLALIETKEDGRQPWTGGGVGEDVAIRGFHSASIRLRDDAAMAELLGFMGYEQVGKREGVTRFGLAAGNGADVVDIEVLPNAADARQGAGSVHHIAFAVEDRAAQLEVRRQLIDTGYQVTPVIDRDYFWAIYFRTPGGVLFEIATNEPGFDRDEDLSSLGQDLKLPSQHEHLRQRLEKELEAIEP